MDCGPIWGRLAAPGRKHLGMQGNFTTQRVEVRFYTYLPTPIGSILLMSTQDRLVGIYGMQQKNYPVPAKAWERTDALPLLQAAVAQLEGYFAGTLVDFALPYVLHGTPFQKEVWQALPQIPYGQVIGYKALAASAGHPKAVRAVAAAVAQNPLSILLPCHRVIRSNGELGGYALGLASKSRLLHLEGGRSTALSPHPK